MRAVLSLLLLSAGCATVPVRAPIMIGNEVADEASTLPVAVEAPRVPGIVPELEPPCLRLP